MAITAHYKMIGQIKTFFETNDSDGKQTVICLHSEGRESRQFHGLMKALEGSFQVTAFDMPGHGKSWPMSGNKPICDLEQYLDFVRHAVQAMGVNRPILLGCGLGADCALALAQEPWVGAVAAVSGGVQTATDVPAELLMDPRVSLPFAVQEYNRNVMGSCAGEEARELIRWQAWCETAITFKADVEMLGRFDIRERLGRTLCPVLLVRGADDWTVDDETQQEIKTVLGGTATVRCASVDGTGRFVMIEKPEALAQLIRELAASAGLLL